MPPLALTDQQMDRLLAAAAGVPCPGMDAIEHAIAVVLGAYGIAGGHRAFVNHRKEFSK